MPDILTRAQPPLEFIAPSFNPLVLRFAQTILPSWLKFKTNISSIEAQDVEKLAEIYHQFQTGKIRFLMAFRHPSTDDPLCMAYLLWRILPQFAREKKIPLQYPTHANFIYDRGIPLWAGAWVGKLYSSLGGTPIMRGKTDLTGLKSVRHLFANSHLPMAAAPEGATNGHNEIISPLEPGISQMCFWCVEDLLKAQRSEQVLIVPIGIKYTYLNPPWQSLEKLLTQLESDSGLISPENSATSSPIVAEQFYKRLYRLGEHFLSLMEDFYRKNYQQVLPKIDDSNISEPNLVLSTRLHNLLDAALKVAEEYFAIQPKGSFIDRCRRTEQAGWDRIYRENMKPTENISLVERALADVVAEEASLRMWHMRIVESFVAVTGHYVREEPKIERFAETTLLLWDLVCRIKGGDPFSRPHLGNLAVQLKVASPISVSERWTDYQTNRRQSVANLTQDLQVKLQSMI